MTHIYRHAQALRQLRDVEICKQLQARRHPSDIYLTVKLVDKVKLVRGFSVYEYGQLRSKKFATICDTLYHKKLGKFIEGVLGTKITCNVLTVEMETAEFCLKVLSTCR